MKEILRVLMVDDHPIIIEGYKNALIAHYYDTHDIQIDVANSCDEAMSFIQKRKSTAAYHLSLLDINLPPSSDGTLTSGEDVALYVRQHHPGIKVIILTMHDERSRLHNILDQVDPEGFLIKSDLSSAELTLAFEQVLSGKTYYSSAVNKHLRKMVVNTFTLDKKNLQILYHLSRGVRTKNLVNHVNLSLSAIEKRKNQLRELFGVEVSNNDEELIEEARRRGFV